MRMNRSWRFLLGIFAGLGLGAMALAQEIQVREPEAPSAPAALQHLEEIGVEEVEATSTWVMDTHRALGTLSLALFSAALVSGAASNNLGKLGDENACCPDGGTRDATVRTLDRVMVDAGIVAYAGAASLSLYNRLIERPVDEYPRKSHQAHRWLALAHGALFVLSAATGITMAMTQDDDPKAFARTARIHSASNVLLVPVLSMALADILFE